MAGKLGNLFVQLGLDTSSFGRGLTKTQRRLREFGRQAKIAFAAAAAAATAAAKVTVSAYAKQESAIVKMEAALRATGKYTPELSAYFQDLASSLQQVGLYGDEELLPMFAKMISMGDMEAGSMRRVMQAALDFSVTAGSLETAVDLLTKASVGYTSTLSRYGIIIDENIPKSQKFEEALRIIESRTRGMQKAMTETTEGAIKQMKNAFGDLTETIGKALAPTVKSFMDDLKFAFEWMQKTPEIVGINRDLVVMQRNISAIEEKIKRLKETEKSGGVVGYGIWGMTVPPERTNLQIKKLQIQLEKERAIFNQRLRQLKELKKLEKAPTVPSSPISGAPKEWAGGMAGTLPLWQAPSPEYLKGMESARQEVKKTTETWLTFASDVQWAWSGTINSMISGTMKFRDFAKRMFQDLLNSYFSMISQRAGQELFRATGDIFRMIPGFGGGGGGGGGDTGYIPEQPAPSLSSAPNVYVQITGPDADRIVDIVNTNKKRKGVLRG